MDGIIHTNVGAETALTAEMRNYITQTMQLMQRMAQMIQSTQERMGELEKQVRMLEKVTPGQARDLNAAIRERAENVCREYRMNGMEKPVAAAIRKTVRLYTGARSMREIARCDYQIVREMAGSWDEYRTIKTIKAKGAGM